MTKVTELLQVPARKVGAALPGVLAVGPAVLELHTERMPNGGSFSRSFIAKWAKGASEGQAHIEIRPTSKVMTEVSVAIARPKGARGLLWTGGARRRLAELFAQALVYEIETRHIEEGDAFSARRTTRELVKARSA
jgi:hypothetical protein